MKRGFFQGTCMHNEVLYGWAFEPGQHPITIWLHAEPPLKPIPIVCNQRRLYRKASTLAERSGFELPIDQLPPDWQQSHRQLRFCFDQQGVLPLQGSECGFMLPAVLHPPDDFKAISHNAGCDVLPFKAQQASHALKRFGGFYPHWYWQRLHQRRPGITPSGNTPELLALCTGAILGVPLNPFDQSCPSDWLKSLWNNPDSQPLLTTPSDLQEAIWLWQHQLWDAGPLLWPDDLPPWFRQHLIQRLEGHAPTVSVIIPNWNRRHTVLRAIDSALQQTYPATEILLTDDGSSDDSLSAIRERFPAALARGQLRLLPGEHGGVSQTRNRALLAARGDWIAYLDSDNTWHPDHLLLLLYTTLECEQQPLISYSGRQLFGARISGHREPVQPFNHSRLHCGNYIDLNCMIHHHSLYEQAGGFDTSLQRLVDWDLILRYSDPSLGATTQSLNVTTVNYWRSSAHLSNISCTRDWNQALTKILTKHKLDPD